MTASFSFVLILPLIRYFLLKTRFVVMNANLFRRFGKTSFFQGKC